MEANLAYLGASVSTAVLVEDLWQCWVWKNTPPFPVAPILDVCPCHGHLDWSGCVCLCSHHSCGALCAVTWAAGSMKDRAWNSADFWDCHMRKSPMNCLLNEPADAFEICHAPVGRSWGSHPPNWRRSGCSCLPWPLQLCGNGRIAMGRTSSRR